MQWWHPFYRWLGTDQSGNLAQWVGGIGTTLALAVAAIPFALERRRAARYQGEAVYLVADIRKSYPYTGKLRVRNASELPVYQVQIIGLYWRRNMIEGTRFRRFPPKYHRTTLQGTPEHDGILPALEARATTRLKSEKMYGTDEYSFLLTFVDARGARWLKHYSDVAPQYWSARRWHKIEQDFAVQNSLETTTTRNEDGTSTTTERWYDRSEEDSRR